MKRLKLAVTLPNCMLLICRLNRCVCVCVCVCVRACVRACLRACVSACVRAIVRACVCVCVCVHFMFCFLCLECVIGLTAVGDVSDIITYRPTLTGNHVGADLLTGTVTSSLSFLLEIVCLSHSWLPSSVTVCYLKPLLRCSQNNTVARSTSQPHILLRRC